MKGEISWKKRREGVRKNREALQGKMALMATYEQMGLARSEAADDLMRQIHRLRMYMRNRTGDDE